MRSEFVQRHRIDSALEVNHLVDRPPEIHPAPAIELRRVAKIEPHALILAKQPKHEPALFLANTQRFATAPHEFVGQTISEPVVGDAEYFDVRFAQTDFLMQFAVHRLLDVFALLQAALRKLPTAVANTARKQQFAGIVRQDDANVCAEAFGVDAIAVHIGLLDFACIFLGVQNRGRRIALSAPHPYLPYPTEPFFGVFRLRRARPAPLFAGLTSLSVAALFAALISGSAAVPVGDVWQSILGQAPPNIEALILGLRLPRALTAFAVGGLLAVAGVMMQVLLRNPLAEPYILGTSGGAAVAALSGMLLGWASVMIDAAAFAGALCAALIVFSVAKGTGSWTPTRLLLTGVVLAAGFSAVTTLLLAISPEEQLRGMLFWLMGDLSFAYSPGRLFLLLALIVAAGVAGARHLDVLSRGELQAAILGLPVAAVRLTLFAVTALAVAMSVTSVGVIGFVGLVVPHLIRLIAGSGHRVLLPASALAGGSLLVVADTLARTVLAPRQLPVGALTAALGVPLFLMIMSRGRRRES